MRKGKKSQMEIMGLVVIVILITLGLFFVIKFMIAKQPSSLKESYTRTEITANLLNSLLKTTSEDCYGMTVTQLLQDCAEKKETSNYIICENNQNSLEYVMFIIETIFDETLIKWGNQNFDFKVYIDVNKNELIDEDEIILQYKNVGCAGEREAKRAYIPTDLGIMTAILEVC